MNAILHEGGQAKNKVELMQKNAKRQIDVLVKVVQHMKVLEKEREDARVLFDHYRSKMAKLEKTHMNSSDTKKLQKYERNLKKFEEAREKFGDATRKLELVMDQIREKSDIIIEQVVFKFTREVEADFYG